MRRGKKREKDKIMSKKKGKKKNPQPTLPLVRLSQCMIVKDEEKNIERALSWAKDIAFEQIVVDTGSTDRTVEIAEKMGAKVYHFEWINDFSAAKNYAIEQATGNWIAFLDADEYISRQDAKKLFAILKKIRSDPDMREKCLVLNIPLVNVDENGNPTSVYDQERVFRNIPQARYKGKIHEMITLGSESVFRMDDIKVVHTGYSETAYEQTGKAWRNIDMLRLELKERPDDLTLKAYLADALKVSGSQEDIEESDRLYNDVINGEGAYSIHVMGAYKYLIEKFIATPGKLADAEAMNVKALTDFPDDIDLIFLYGMIMNMKGEYKTAWEQLTKCEEKLMKSKSLDDATYLMAKPTMLFQQLAAAAQGLGDVQGLVRNTTMVLSADKTRSGILKIYIAELINHNTPYDEIEQLLSTIYDFKDTRDILLVARAAKDCGALDFAKKVLEKAETSTAKQ